MPQIIVTAGSADDQIAGTVMLRERVNATDFESERFAANLLERLGWAVEDATAAEQREVAAQRDTPDLSTPQGLELDTRWDVDKTHRDPEPAGVR
jgi:hypothetical protein